MTSRPGTNRTLASRSSTSRFANSGNKPWQRSGTIGGQVAPEDASKVFEKVTQQARASGILNLAGRFLDHIPDEVWNMYNVDPKKVDLDFNNSDRWWESVELTKFFANDNLLKELDARIGHFEALTVLDLHNNQLKELPNEMSQLNRLCLLNLAGNELEALPEFIFDLPLVELHLQRNKLSSSLDGLERLSKLSILDLSDNSIDSIPENIGQLKSLRKLNLTKNKLTSLPTSLSDITSLSELEVKENSLTQIFNKPATLSKLLRLDLSRNKLTGFIDELNFPILKELLCAGNNIKSLGNLLVGTPALHILDLQNNSLDSFPPNLFELKEIKVLDFRNNYLSQLPLELCHLTTLQTVYYDGNPLKNFPRAKSTADLLHTLEIRLLAQERAQNKTEKKDTVETAPSNESRPKALNEKQVIDRNIETQTAPKASPTHNTLVSRLTTQQISARTLDLTKNSLTNLEESSIADLTFSPIHIKLDFNALTTVPTVIFNYFETLTTLTLTHNKITEFPIPSHTLPALRSLDLSHNLITSIPLETEAFPALAELYLNFNRIAGTFPAKLPFPNLSILEVSSNKLDAFQPDAFHGLVQLDLSNNNIARVPPELGLIDTITRLQLEGNVFRVPRYELLQKGTQEIMSYLKSRVAK
ncbi:L domain-like protein [Basidiobolus meristosporus CBS 931.73]|uniref:L domain-like protein n=1 Tax=Basidiobolus meristosporus CBS 931.73 TaxID=1314790 RepID=A0A1Y1Z5W5_9FUNG|nr:L domain-like protein [Basidiobolus meristosporus CBS 931.73]|eukprot:ORY05630.1 L domain-like protein [Basidiobolus meristosporus CBS 931.73]